MREIQSLGSFVLFAGLAVHSFFGYTNQFTLGIAAGALAIQLLTLADTAMESRELHQKNT